ncbi:DUF1822 family protein [Baaleninema sp.]|uniref:DUF1822 family protein n=1 Tax=Baaleninema sp. TaxID=3101197 RepID=UPI003D04786E
MNSKSRILQEAVSMPVTENAKQLARQFAGQQPTADKARRVYLNTLAVYAIDNFLRMMGVATAPEAGDSSNAAVRFASDTADLPLVGLGRLECRPSTDSTATVYPVPPEVRDDRIGYTVVRLDETQDRATLLGFVPHVREGTIRSRDLQPIEELLVYLHRLRVTVPVASPLVIPPQTVLSRWLDGVFESGWQALETLFETPHAELAFRLQHQTVKRAKRLTVGSTAIALTVALDTTQTPKIELLLALYPIEASYLPPHLKLLLLDEEDKAVMEAETRQDNHNVQFEFRGETGDRFSVRLVLDDESITESFAI